MKIHLKGNWETKDVWLNGKKLSPEKSQKIRNHSPDGFNWGYGGSGPAQLALAICLELYGNHDGYQDFKFRHIGGLPQSDFDVEIEVPGPVQITADMMIEELAKSGSEGVREKCQGILAGRYTKEDLLKYSGSFLTYVLKGDFYNAYQHADMQNKAALNRLINR